MTTRHPIVFLKPVTGSLGKGIIRISRQPGGSFVCHTTSLNGVRKQVFPTLTALFNSIFGKMKLSRHQIQQGLRLMEVGGRPVDIRVLVQRDGTGSWKITSTVARIASTNTFVSNLARGGTVCTVKEALARSNVMTASKNAVIVKLRKAALEIAGGIENRIPEHFAELGVDLAIDISGKIWLLEVNSKPSKDHNTPTENGKTRPSIRQIVQYCQFAAKF